MPLNLPCRFRADHGVFSNGIALRKHYDHEHPEYVPPPAGQSSSKTPGMCSCGTPMQSGSWLNHARHVHNSAPQYFWSPLPASKIVRSPMASPERSRPSEAHVEPDPVTIEVDDIVIPAITAMAHPGEVVPVAHLAALFAWRDATAVMLRAVGR